MRTTLDLPDELLKRAKIAAVERGVTLRELVESALANDLAAGPAPALEGQREILATAVGVDERRRRLTRYVTWSQEDLAEFNQALSVERSTDDPLWR
jgi:hypothetical protein